jgi:CDP-4-dehydro-6-deoxyglucose reductase, E1
MKEEIKKLVDNLYQEFKTDAVPVSGKIFGKEEIENLIEASFEGWWTEGKWCEEFEQGLKDFIGVKYLHSCNSGSSANLLAFTALCSHTLGEKRIKRGDEVITLAAGFPTTINPIIQNGCVPVFIDITLPYFGPDLEQLQKALSKKTKAVIIAHTLGNPFDIDAVKAFCQKNDLWLIEDNCDALGSTYKGKKTGTFGDIATFSFYPAHQITTAEGGAVATNNPDLSKIIRSIRDWGRHCWCSTGKDNTCKNRYNWKLGDLPQGYDHKYIYGEIGYNLKLSDLHAAIGVAQLKRLPEFVKARQENFRYLKEKLNQFSDYFILPEAEKNSEPSWFGFLLTIKDDKINRPDFLRFLEQEKIGTRLLFGGNMTKQPYFFNNPDITYRLAGDLKTTDLVMEKTFWIGVYPGLDKTKLDRIISAFNKYLKND